MKLLMLLFTLMFMASAVGFAGEGGRGSIPQKIDEAAFRQYILDGGLKASMLHYLDTIDLSQVKNPEIHKTFERMLKDQALQKDISTPRNYRVGLKECDEPLLPVKGKARLVRASTSTGSSGIANIGGRVCFDLPGLVSDFRSQGLSVEDAVIKLAAVTFHEHVHHFQESNSNPNVILQEENEANNLAGYVELTAKLAQVPLLKWADSAAVSQEYVEVVTCKTITGPQIGLHLSSKAIDVLLKRNNGRFPGFAAGTDMNEPFPKTSFSMEYACEPGSCPILETKHWPMDQNSSIPVLIEKSGCSQCMNQVETELISPQWEIVGPVSSMKFRDEYKIKQAQFTVKAKLVTYKIDVEETAKNALSNNQSVDDALKAEAAKYQAGLVDSEIACTFEGLVR